MPRVNLQEADLERQDDDGTFCRSCRAPAEGDGPYCVPCGDYWAECDAGLWDDIDEEWRAREWQG